MSEKHPISSREVMSLSRLFAARDKVSIATLRREWADSELTIAQIRERAAELESQHEPLNEFLGGDREVREKVLRVVFFVLNGRWATDEEWYR